MEINNDIEENYCSFEVSNLLQLKGFKVHCDFVFDLKKENQIVSLKDAYVNECIEYDINYAYKSVERLKENYYHQGKNEDLIYRPTHSIAIKWIKDNFQLDIYYFVSQNSKEETLYKSHVFDLNKNYIYHIYEIDPKTSKSPFAYYETGEYISSHKAIEAALLRTLKELI